MRWWCSSGNRRQAVRPIRSVSRTLAGGELLGLGLGGTGLVTGIVLMILNYSTLTGSTATWVNSLPLLLPAAAVIGTVVAGRQPAHEPSDDDHAQIADVADIADAAPVGPASASA